MDEALRAKGSGGAFEPPIAAHPPYWAHSHEAREAFLATVRQAAQATLILDYDGTLAPFHANKMKARPFPGVMDRLLRLVAGPTRLAFITGRPVAELMILLPLAAGAELWGMHGREHRSPDGHHALLAPTAAQRAVLDQAQDLLEKAQMGSLLERKVASIAVHWRTLDTQLAVKQRTYELLAPLAGQDALALLPFDGGLELRAEDHTKGHAISALLAETDARAAAYLGDDTTDEDAFQAINSLGGLSLLVRNPPRASSARFCLSPPGDLLQFLDQWLNAIGASHGGTLR